MRDADIDYKVSQCGPQSAALWAALQLKYGPTLLAVVEDIPGALKEELDDLLDDDERRRIEPSGCPRSEYSRGWRNGYETVLTSLEDLIPVEEPPS